MHLVQRLLSSRENKGFGSGTCRAEDFRRRVSVVRRSAASDLVQRLPQNLVLSFPLHQVFGVQFSVYDVTWCFTPRNPLFLRFLCTKSLVFFGASTLRTWCKDSRKTLFLRFLCTKSLALFGAPTLRTWCKDSRKTLFLRFLCTKSLALFGAPTLRTWCKDSRKTLFFRFPCTKSPA